MERVDGKSPFREALKPLKLGLIDMYIIRKFLGTFFFCIVLILAIAVVFDFAEKIDNFMEKQAPVKAIIFDYYLNFIPYFGTLFAPMFVFISVIFFTAKMAIHTEIIAILNGGMSFRRMMWPYFLSSLLIAILTFVLTNFIIPHANLKRLAFEDQYYRSSSRKLTIENLHRQVYPNVYIYMGSYNPISQRGQNFTIEKLSDSGRVVSKLSAFTVVYDTAVNKWAALNYYIREIKGDEEVFTRGSKIDTALIIRPEDLSRDPGFVGTMNYRELNDYIELLKMQGSDELKLFLIEKHRRFSNPFAIFILSIIGVSLSSKKIRGGIGMSIGIGLVLTFSYILFQQFSSQFSLKGNLAPMLAMWIPNIIYTGIGFVLYKMAPK
ncbi:MAG: LptF/LptG family permease [Bacteroidales bacterium]|jgi:lipopolysaccharide export system permease protein|nr:LptF/LptG family permease [Bacteroidales bacterium]MCU0407633.1 LptF/LptG family permease [Bacteroidales bacterium]